MNIIVIYGSVRKTNTYNCVQLLLNNLRLNINIKVTEFFLPNDYFYYKNLFYHANNIKTYDDTTDINYILRYLDSSDLIILASSVTSCDMSNKMKILLNNLSSCCISNNIHSQMHNKIGLAFTTSAGAGLFYVTKILKKNLKLFGINNTLKFSKALYENNYEDVNSNTKEHITQLSYRILNLYNEINSINSSVFSTKPFLNPNIYLKYYKSYLEKLTKAFI